MVDMDTADPCYCTVKENRYYPIKWGFPICGSKARGAFDSGVCSLKCLRKEMESGNG